MPTSGIVPIPCADAAEGVVQLPANSKRPSKLSGACARRAARRKVLAHVALGHRVVQRKSPPLVGFTSLPVASLLSPATAAALHRCHWKQRLRHHRLGNCHLRRLVGCLVSRHKLSQLSKIQDRSWQCHLCTYEQDLVPGSRTCIMCHSTRRWLHCASWCVVKSKLVDRTRGSGKSGCPNCRLGDRCKACRLACREKCIDDIWIDAKGPLK
jgi:hypothetical protein